MTFRDPSEDRDTVGSAGPLRWGAQGGAGIAAGLAVLVGVREGMDVLAYGVALAVVVAPIMATLAGGVHRLDRRLRAAQMADALTIEAPARTLVKSVARMWIGVGLLLAVALLVASEEATIAGVGALAIAVGLSNVATAVVLRRWERRHGERVAVVGGELRRVTLAAPVVAAPDGVASGG